VDAELAAGASMADADTGVHGEGWTALTHGAASQSCELAAFEGLIKRAVAGGVFLESANARDALSMAARVGAEEKVNALLAAGADPCLRTSHEGHVLNALTYCRMPAHHRCLSAILDALPPGAVELRSLAVFVRQAAGHGNREAVAALAGYGGEPLRRQLVREMGGVVAGIALGDGISALDRTNIGDPQSALRMAVSLDELELVRELAEPGAQALRALDGAGQSLLAHAAEGDAVRVAEWLLANGADPDQAGCLGWTPLQRAVSHNSVRVARLLRDAGAELESEEGPLITEATAETIPLLLDAGADIDGFDDCGNCPLVDAVESGDLDLVRYLLDRGATVDNRDSSDKTALQRAADLEEAAIVKLLLKRGADPNIQDLDGYRTLDYAKSKYLQQLVRDAGGEEGPRCW